jgi:hypothetical protein
MFKMNFRDESGATVKEQKEKKAASEDPSDQKSLSQKSKVKGKKDLPDDVKLRDEHGRTAKEQAKDKKE